MVRIINFVCILSFLYLNPKVIYVNLYGFEWDHLTFGPEKVNENNYLWFCF